MLPKKNFCQGNSDQCYNVKELHSLTRVDFINQNILLTNKMLVK